MLPVRPHVMVEKKPVDMWCRLENINTVNRFLMQGGKVEELSVNVDGW